MIEWFNKIKYTQVHRNRLMFPSAFPDCCNVSPFIDDINKIRLSIGIRGTVRHFNRRSI